MDYRANLCVPRQRERIGQVERGERLLAAWPEHVEDNTLRRYSDEEVARAVAAARAALSHSVRWGRQKGISFAYQLEPLDLGNPRRVRIRARD